MKKTFVTILLLAGALAGAHAQDAASVAMPFSRIERNAAGLAMGGVYTTINSPAAAVFGSNEFTGEVSAMMWQPGSSVLSSSDINASVAYRIGDKLAVSAAVALDNGAKIDDFAPSDAMIDLGLGFKVVDFLSVGANLRFLNSSIAQDYSKTAFSADVLAVAKFSSLRAAAGVRSLGTPVKSAEGGSFKLPSSVTAGVMYDLGFGSSSIGLGADLDYFLYGAVAASAGAQYCWNDMVSLRAGYHYGGVVADFASVGAGVRFSGVNVDLTYLAGGALANTVMLAVGYSF